LYSGIPVSQADMYNFVPKETRYIAAESGIHFILAYFNFDVIGLSLLNLCARVRRIGRAPGTQRIWGSVGSRAGVDTVEREKFRPVGNRLGCSPRSPLNFF
jgi:hypothetical protein